MNGNHCVQGTRPAHLGWRLLALLYDALPALGIWFAVSALLLLARGGVPAASGSFAGWLELAALWLATGAYATLSWHFGGQTLGLRAWRLRVVDARGRPPSWSRAWLRFALALPSLLALGLGFAWALIDARRRTWHDLAAGTSVVRQPREEGDGSRAGHRPP